MQRRPPDWFPQYGFAMASEIVVGVEYLAQYQGTSLKSWQIPCLVIAMLLAAYIGWVTYPLMLSGTQKALRKGKPKALERSRLSTKNFTYMITFGMPKNAFERRVAG